MAKILVAAIAFNEEKKIEAVIKRLLECSLKSTADYLIVDDGSTDQTPEIIQRYGQQGIKTIRHLAKEGVGASIRAVIHHAEQHQYDVLVIMAGNNKDDPNEIPKLLDPILARNVDFVQGSRYKGHVGIGGDMPFYRKVATRLYPLLLSVVSRRRITDGSNGFRAFRLSIFKDKKINIDQPWLDGYELEPYLFVKVIKLGYKVEEVPVTKIYPPRELGYTKMRPILGWWSILKPLVYLGLRIKK